MKYIRIEMKFKNRERMLVQEKKKIVKSISNDADIIVSNQIDCYNNIFPVDNIVLFDIHKYREVLFRMKKMLNLCRINDVLKLIMKRDKCTLRALMKELSFVDLRNVLGALVVFTDSYFVGNDKLIVVMSEDACEQMKDIRVHHFFRIYTRELKDERMIIVPSWTQFARMIADQKGREAVC